MEGNKKLRLKEAAELSGYHSDYLGYLVRSKKLKGEKIGKSWFVAEADLRRLLRLKRKEIEEELPLIKEEIRQEIAAAGNMLWPKAALALSLISLLLISLAVSLILSDIIPSSAGFSFADKKNQEFQYSEAEKMISSSVFGN